MNTSVNNLLLETAFACMSCDGEIAKEEVCLLKELSSNDSLFGSIDINEQLEVMTKRLKTEGKSYLKSYLSSLNSVELSEDDELQLLNVAVKTIYADNVIAYDEIKFFKAIRSHLKVNDDTILSSIEGVDDMWLAKDFSSVFSDFDNEYFDNIHYNDIIIPEDITTIK